MPETVVTRTQTNATQTKGQIQTQEYSGSTTRTAAGSPVTTTENKTGSGTEEIIGSATRGTTQTVTASTGGGKTVVNTEDKGVTLEFMLSFQNRQPIIRAV